MDIKLSIYMYGTSTETRCIPFSVSLCVGERELSVTRVRLLLLTMASLCVDAEQRNKMQRAGAPAVELQTNFREDFTIHNKLVERAYLCFPEIIGMDIESRTC